MEYMKKLFASLLSLCPGAKCNFLQQGEGSWNLYHKNHIEKVGAQTRKLPSVKLAEESYWDLVKRTEAAHMACLWTMTLLGACMPSAGNSESSMEQVPTGEIFTGTQQQSIQIPENMVECELGSCWVCSNSGSRDSATNSELRLQSWRSPPVRTSGQNPLLVYSYCM
jgi:hypothetical protein